MMKSSIKCSFFLALLAILGMTASASSNAMHEKINSKKEKSSYARRLFSTGIDIGLLGTCITSGVLAIVLHTAAENDRVIYGGALFSKPAILELAHVFQVFEILAYFCGADEKNLSDLEGYFVNGSYRSTLANGVALGCATASVSCLGLLLLKRSYSKENSKKKRWIVSQRQ